MRNWAEHGDDECTRHEFPTGGSVGLQRVADIYGWNVDRGETLRASVEHIGATHRSQPWTPPCREVTRRMFTLD